MSTVRIALANVRVPSTPEGSVLQATAPVAEAGRQGALVICHEGWRYPETVRWAGRVVARSNRFRRREVFVRYLLGVGGVMLFQSGLSFAIIRATAGGGSFVGLGVMLAAVPGIPLTALVNALLIRSSRKDPAAACARRVVLASLALPAVQLALLALVSVFRL